MFCHNCGSNNTESDAASGTSYCIDCGTVLEENTIVSEVTFGEASNGKAILQGSFAGESGRIAGGGLMGRKRKEGQEQAIDNGRIKIANIAHALNLPERYRESAQRYYNLAVVNQFTRGRKSDHVAAICLYCVCRSEKSAHMLIDFSDLLQINVFTLGATFLKLCRVLNLSLPQIDPSIYISRFAVALDFGDYTQRVAQDAVRIVQRMDRDWITSGRRPAGICGACLLIAARMNGFRRTVKEMIYIVKVAEVTIQKRLQEFNNTESSKLSVRDFRTVWLDSRADPPSYQRNRKLEEEEAASQLSIDEANQRDTDLWSPLLVEENENETSVTENGDKQSVSAECHSDEEAEKSRKRKETESVDHDRQSKRLMKAIHDHDKEIDITTISDKKEDSRKRKQIENMNDSPHIKRRNIGESSSLTNNQEEIEVNNVNVDEEQIINQLVQQEIEKSLNEEVQQVENVDIMLTAEASIIRRPSLKGKEKVTSSLNIDENAAATQIGTQVSYLEDDHHENDTQATLVDKEFTQDYISLNDKAYNELSIEDKRRLTAIAKEKIARERDELLDPVAHEQDRQIGEEMESWLGDESIQQAAESLKKERKDRKKDEEEDVQEDSLSDVDDEEIEAMILTADEVMLKTKIWYNNNKDYLEEMAVRRMVEKEKDSQPHTRKINRSKKNMQRANTPAEAAKQLMATKKISKKINQAIFDDLFETPESIAKIKERDVLNRITSDNNISVSEYTNYEVVEESGDVSVAATKSKNKDGKPALEDSNSIQSGQVANDDDDDDDDDEDMDPDDMADDERFLREARANYTFDDTEYGDEYGDGYDDDDY
ncbi:uncharacterized protein BX663DRAFT_445246 [Cokeromyces recurvatus]|uniref:uncharacterized protein n=1 Tax=Cokeromyces recurvatus TaxID=90255 RepID=UPI002220CC37|nr:uncharacterized protein BX663DRAFT_445246 [Cokeromyces recurvatus]KAI7907515.1 hypothetical protein BX663DRAFT_445246 [Cokeromyces recurvatus]